MQKRILDFSLKKVVLLYFLIFSILALEVLFFSKIFSENFNNLIWLSTASSYFLLGIVTKKIVAPAHTHSWDSMRGKPAVRISSILLVFLIIAHFVYFLILNNPFSLYNLIKSYLLGFPNAFILHRLTIVLMSFLDTK